MSVLRRDMPFYKNGGGITLSGGEPMMQADFVLELARVAKGEGISVMIETSGFGKKSDFERIAPFCDAFLFDCKASAPRHLELVGVSDDVILDNLGYLDSVGARIIIRAPIVPGANLDSEFVEKLRSLKRKYASVEKIELLPYHKIGLSKNKRLGLCDQTEFAVPTPELIDQIYAELEK